MKLKTQTFAPVDVKLLVGDEEQTLTLKVNCLTPRKLKAYVDKLEETKEDFDASIKTNCEVVCGWSGVVDEKGAEVEFSKEKLSDIQYDYFGLADSIAYAICGEGAKLRKKCVSLWVDTSRKEESEN